MSSQRRFDNRRLNYNRRPTHGNSTRRRVIYNDRKALKSLEGWILFITNLHEETSEDDIREAFSEFGVVVNVHLNLDRRTGFVKGYALVEFRSYEEASSAKECLNMSDLLGVAIKVDWAFVQN